MWQPLKGRDQALEAYCSTITSLVKSHVPQPPIQQNISRNNRAAIHELQQLVRDRKIRSSPVDKGRAVVVQNFEDNKKEALRQLDNLNSYQ